MNPVIRHIAGYSLFVVGIAPGFEKGLGGFVGGSFLWAMFTTVPAAVFFGSREE